MTNIKKTVGIIKGIKDILKGEFNLDLVLIQVGFYIEVIEEDADYFHKEFDFELHDAGGRRSYNVTGFPKQHLDKYLEILDERKIWYAVVEQIDVGEDRVTREVTYSPNRKALGLVF